MSLATVDALRLHPHDNVGVAARPLRPGETIDVAGDPLAVRESVGLGHKIALATIAAGAAVHKFGQPIGVATRSIGAGDLVHTHNLSPAARTSGCLKSTDVPPAPSPVADRTFQGYRRADGRAGTRNYVAVISTVNCSASVSKYVAQHFDAQLLAQYPNVDGILPLTHTGGCSMPFAGEQHEMLNRVLAGMARHPNIGAYLLIGLGCEQGSLDYLVDSQHLVQIDGAAEVGTAARPPTLSLQECGGTRQTVERAVERLAELLPLANDVRRETIPAGELILATECGGSDGNSGVTANPAVGHAADLLVAAGGTVILSETPEIYGAEQLLTRRARTPAVADKLLERLAWWERYASWFGAELDNNPTVGNKAGGLTTIYEKSLGAVAKGGTTALEEVLLYAEPVTGKGLVVMDTPSFDPVSVTGMVAGGANLVTFTTGRGSCYGCKPVPSLKIASNTPMYERMRDDMDIDAGRILSGATIEEIGHEIFERLLAVASGETTRSEQHGIGEEEFIPWHVGPML